MEINNQEEWLILPKDIIPEKEIWEQVGFQFLEIENNNISWEVKLPKNWTIEKQNQYMCDNILDESRMIRGKIIYKSRVNNKPTCMILNSRYGICMKNISDDYAISIIYFGNDEEKLFVAGQINRTKCATREERLKLIKEEKELLQATMNWANENYPDWQNINAYWDLPTKQNEKTRIKK